MKRNYLILVYIFLFHHGIFSQEQLKIDSLSVSLQFAQSDTLKINLLWELADQYITSDYKVALKNYEEALQLSEAIEDQYRISKSQMLIGKVHALSGVYDEALKNVIKAIESFKKQNNLIELYESYILMGIIHDRIVKYDEALDYYYKAVNISNILKSKQLSPSNHLLKEQILFNNIGNIYFSKLEYNKAIEYYNKGIESSIANKDMVNLGVLYNNKGRIYGQLKEYDKAKDFLEKGLNTRKQNKDKAGMAKSHYFMSAHYMNQNNYEEALKHAHQSLLLGKEVGSIQSQYNAIYFLYQLNYKIENYKKAADYHVNYKSLSDSMYNSRTLNEITRLKLEAKYVEHEAKRKLQTQRTKFKYASIIVVLVISLLVLTFIYLLLQAKSKRINLEKINLEKDIEVKNKELATNVMYMVGKNEMINGVAKKLLTLKKTAVEKNQKPIQNIILELESETDKNIWKEFELRFQNVHNEFYEHLLKKHPNLSPNESRLVAFLRLNMSTKEIASITHQNIKSVEVARARLRKKLNLTGTDTNLVSYLNSF